MEASIIEKMMLIMRHRGPDGAGRLIADNIGLGHRRLSIIDIENGSQPICNETNEIYVVFNGEIYNYLELQDILEAKGHIFKTRSDTEVIVHGYEEWGEKCVTYFNGMFAFAVYDFRKNTLFLARDHLGVKPLYYTQVRGAILFASEIKALLESGMCERKVYLEGLSNLFIYRYVPSPDTLFEGIKKLPPGHSLTATSKTVSIQRFWVWKPVIRKWRDEQEAVEQYQFLLHDAIKLQLRSDVPVGLFLSSGIDSNAILAIMAEHVTSPIHTFTLGFEGGETTNETNGAKKMAEKFGTDHSELIIDCEDYERYYEHYLWDLEEPVGNETAAAFYFLSKLASEKVKVALTGQGADEPWAGYRRYVGVKLSDIYAKLPLGLTNLLAKAVMALPRNESLKRGVTALNERDIKVRFKKIYSFFSEEMREQLFQDWLKNQISESVKSPSRIDTLQNDVIDLDHISQMLYIDSRGSLPDDLLMVNDKTSMANSIETRVPYLDHRLVEFIETLPPTWKLKGLEGKYLHKKALQKWLPRELIYQKKKGFANPINNWLRHGMNRYVQDCLLSESSATSQYFNKSYLNKIVKSHNDNTEEYFRQIYLLVSFELWYKTFMKA